MSKAEHETHVKNECPNTIMQCMSCKKILGERKEVQKLNFSHKIKDCVDEIILKTKKVKKDKVQIEEDMQKLRQAEDTDRWSRDPGSKYHFNRVVAKIKDREKRGLVDSGTGFTESFSRVPAPSNPFSFSF
jgi:hypothetical protein